MCSVFPEPLRRLQGQVGVNNWRPVDTPMIVTNVGGLPEIVEDGKVGYVVDVDEKSIAEAIVKFYNENKKHEFEENVIHAKEKFSWDYFIDKLSAFVKE